MARHSQTPRLAWPPAWSFTLHRLLGECERAVYWRYGAARRGAQAPADSEDRRAWVLSHLTSLPLQLGITLHNAARSVLLAVRDGRPQPAYDELLASARFTLNHVWLTSTRQLDRFYRWPGAYTAFSEIVYRGAFREAEIVRARWALAACLRHLLDTPLLGDLRHCRMDEILVGDLPAQFEVSPGVSAWAAFDLAYVHHDPATCRGLASTATWCITDFKTGAPAPQEARDAEQAVYMAQLASYAIFVRDVLRLPMTDGAYVGRVVHLRSGTDSWFRIRDEDIEQARRLVHADVERLRNSATDYPDGAPISKAPFPLTSDARRCGRCSFAALCEGELGARRNALGRGT